MTLTAKGFSFFCFCFEFQKEAKVLCCLIQKTLYSPLSYGRRLVKNPLFLFAGALLFDEKIRPRALQSVF
jgi:hypothetical protein